MVSITWAISSQTNVFSFSFPLEQYQCFAGPGLCCHAFSPTSPNNQEPPLPVTFLHHSPSCHHTTFYSLVCNWHMSPFTRDQPANKLSATSPSLPPATSQYGVPPRSDSTITSESFTNVPLIVKSTLGLPIIQLWFKGWSRSYRLTKLLTDILTKDQSCWKQIGASLSSVLCYSLDAKLQVQYSAFKTCYDNWNKAWFWLHGRSSSLSLNCWCFAIWYTYQTRGWLVLIGSVSFFFNLRSNIRKWLNAFYSTFRDLFPLAYYCSLHLLTNPSLQAYWWCWLG